MILIRLMNWSVLIEILVMKLSGLIQIHLMKWLGLIQIHLMTWCSFGGPAILEIKIFYVILINFNDHDNIDTENASSPLTFGGGISGHSHQK